MKLTIESGGKLTLPERILTFFDWEEGDELVVGVEARTLLLKKEVAECCLCGTSRDLVRAGEVFLCRDCLRRLSEAEADSVFYRR